MLRQVGEQHCHSESNVLGRVVEAVSELCEVHLAIMVGIHTHHNVFYLLTENAPQSLSIMLQYSLRMKQYRE